MKILKKIFLVIVVLLVLAQLYPRAGKNRGGNIANDISNKFDVPDTVMHTLTSGCYDCHSNNTVYPWYAHVQPVAAWLEHHIKEGKAELNFSEFGSYSLAKQFHKLEEINEQVKEKEMPLQSYIIIHDDARLSETQRSALASWAESARDVMRKTYPADSLVRKRN